VECHKQLFILKLNPGVVFSGGTTDGKIGQEAVPVSRQSELRQLQRKQKKKRIGVKSR